MTEDDAKQKWCPFVRHSTQNPTHGGADPGINRYGAGIDFNKDSGIGAGDIAWNKCIGSACMAWRWDNTYESLTEEGQGGDVVLRLKRKSGEPKLGWCGLAGKP